MDNKRSPNYPSIGLPEAISLAKQLWDREKRSQVPSDVAAQAWGYKGQNGVSRMKIASLKKFGLLEGRGSDGVRLTDLALPLVAYAEGSPEYRAAAQEAALKPDVFREMFQTHAHASVENLQAYLITRRGFSASGAKQFAKAFHETIGVVDPDSPRYTEPSEPMETTALATQRQTLVPPNIPVVAEPSAAADTFSIVMGPLSVSVRVAGEKIAAKHLQLVRQYLAVAEAQLKMEKDIAGSDADGEKVE